MLPLSFNVTYWNSPAWTDKDSLQAATERQGWYAGLAGSQNVYTPQAVVDGTTQLAGSDATKLAAAIAAAQAAPAGNVPVSVQGGPKMCIRDRLSTQVLTQPERTLNAAHVIAGAHWMVPPAPGASIAIATQGAVAGEAEKAFAQLDVYKRQVWGEVTITRFHRRKG